MSNIQNIESTPPHISEFLKKNMDQLINIHDEGKQEHGDGCLGFKCSQTDNKMDVFYMNESTIISMMENESWQQLKNTMNGKKLFFVNDLDKKSIFLIYI